MGRPKTGLKTEVIGLSITKENAEYIRKVRNSSRFVNEAISEKRRKETNPEVLLSEIKKRKKELAIEINALTDKEEEIKQKIAPKGTKTQV
jgi:vacuolar-type H+-ATPase subunit I/STV1